MAAARLEDPSARQIHPSWLSMKRRCNPRLQIHHHIVRVIERLQNKPESFLLLYRLEPGRQPLGPDLLMDHLPMFAVLVVVLMGDQEVFEPTQRGKIQLRSCRRPLGFLPHDSICSLFVVEDDEGQAHHGDRADGTIGIFVLEPMLELRRPFGWEIQNVADDG